MYQKRFRSQKFWSGWNTQGCTVFGNCIREFLTWLYNFFGLSRRRTASFFKVLLRLGSLIHKAYGSHVVIEDPPSNDIAVRSKRGFQHARRHYYSRMNTKKSLLLRSKLHRSFCLPRLIHFKFSALLIWGHYWTFSNNNVANVAYRQYAFTSFA